MDPTSLIRLLSSAADKQLGMSSLRILCHLHTHKSTTLGVLKGEIRVTVSAITGLSDRLVDLGYAIRRPGVSDRRQIWLEITPAGTAAIQEILATITEPVPA